MTPVARHPPVGAAIRERERDGQPALREQRRFHANRQKVMRRMADGQDLDALPLQLEPAAQKPGPQVQGLRRVRQILDSGGGPIALGQTQSDPAEVQPMRIGAEPIGGGRVSAGASSARSVGHLASRHLVLLENIRHPVALGIRQTVPAPLRQRAQRHPLFVVRGKRLQARDIGREGELAIAHAQRRQRIGLGQGDVVPRHQRESINPRIGPSACVTLLRATHRSQSSTPYDRESRETLICPSRRSLQISGPHPFHPASPVYPPAAGPHNDVSGFVLGEAQTIRENTKGRRSNATALLGILAGRPRSGRLPRWFSASGLIARVPPEFHIVSGRLVQSS